MLQDFMNTLFSGLLLVVLVFELSKPFKSLKESGWNLKKEKTRVYLSRLLSFWVGKMSTNICTLIISRITILWSKEKPHIVRLQNM